MRKIKVMSVRRKFVVYLLSILILLAASIWWSVKMIYVRHINSDVALFLAKTYHLTAGRATTASEQLTIYLDDYIADEKFALEYLEKQALAKDEKFEMSTEQIRDITWEKVLRQNWVNHLAKKNKLTIVDQDVVDFYNSIGGQENLQQGLKSAKIDFGQYENHVIKPSIMEAKVYKYLLDNFNDLVGMQKAQNAYQALVDEGGVFEEVAKEFSDDMTYVEDSMFIDLEQLGDFGEPIKNLQVGEYSKIMVLPGNPGYYIIWRLQGASLDPDTSKEIKELRGIAIKAKSIDEFFSDWKTNAKISRWYK